MTVTAADTWWEILELDASASDVEIQNAFQRLSKEYHPDTTKGDRVESARMMRLISDAYRRGLSAQGKIEARLFLSSGKRPEANKEKPKLGAATKKVLKRKIPIEVVATVIGLVLIGVISYIFFAQRSEDDPAAKAKRNQEAQKKMLKDIGPRKFE